MNRLFVHLSLTLTLFLLLGGALAAAETKQAKPNILFIVADDMGFGISTPLIVHWPAGIKAHDELRTNPGHLIDLVPTVLELVGGSQPATVGGLPVPPFQGKSLAPVFAKDGSVAHDYLWFNHEGNRAIRIGDWKLVADHTSPWELYDLSGDRSETKNLASAHPEKVKELEKDWIKHAQEMHDLSMQDPHPPNAGQGGR